MSCNFGLKSYLWFQIELALRARSILKPRVWFQTKLHSTQFNYHYLYKGLYDCPRGLFFSGRTWVCSNRIRCFSLWTGPSFYGEKVMLGNKIFIRSCLKMVLYFRSQDLSLIRAWNLCLLESQTSGRQHFWISWGRRGLVAIRTRLRLVGQREKARRREVDPQLVSREAHKHAGNSLSNVLVVIP